MLSRSCIIPMFRWLLGEYHLACQTAEVQDTRIPPLFVLCNGQDKQHLAAMSSQLATLNGATHFNTTTVSMQGILKLLS